jgi:hypothetical protein
MRALKVRFFGIGRTRFVDDGFVGDWVVVNTLAAFIVLAGCSESKLATPSLAALSLVLLLNSAAELFGMLFGMSLNEVVMSSTTTHPTTRPLRMYLRVSSTRTVDAGPTK